MTTLLIILLGTVLIQNSVTLSSAAAGATVGSLQEELARFATVSLELLSASILGYVVETYLLEPFGIAYLRTVALAVLLALVFLAERRLWWREVHSKTVLAHFTEHCTTWGMALFSAWNLRDWQSVLSYGIAAGVGLALLDAAFRAHRARFATAAVPFVFRGIPLDLITAGLMALALYGFVGF